MRCGKTHGPLLQWVVALRKSNILVQEGLLHDEELNGCELFIEDCTLTQSFKCYYHGHTAKMCKSRKNYGFELKNLTPEAVLPLRPPQAIPAATAKASTLNGMNK